MGNISSLIGTNQPYVKPSVDYNVATAQRKPLQPGWYTATVENADVKPNKAGTGSFLEVEFSIENRRIREYLNIQHTNPTVQEIGLRELAKLQDACGITQLEDSEQLIAKTLSVRVVIKEDPNYGPTNRINGFARLDGKYENSTFKPKTESRGFHDIRQKRGVFGVAPFYFLQNQSGNQSDIDPSEVPF